jgi:hypothetical protein
LGNLRPRAGLKPDFSSELSPLSLLANKLA